MNGERERKLAVEEVNKALHILWNLEDKLSYECANISQAINILQKVKEDAL